jgi:hypothetical protein
MPTFTPPTVAGLAVAEQGGRGVANRLFSFFGSWAQGQAVWKDQAGVWHQNAWPDNDDLLAAQVVYDGGHVHEVTDAEAAELIAAGFGDNLGEYQLELDGEAIEQSQSPDYGQLWVDYIADAGSESPTGNRRILGGDCVEIVQTGADGFLWLWLDVWAAGTGAVEDEQYTTNNLLPFRNAVAGESPAGTLGTQVFESGSNEWLDPAVAGYPDSYVWWPTGGVRPGLTGSTYVVAHLLDGAHSSEGNFGVVGTSLITLTLFATYQSHVQLDFGTQANFWLTRLREDDDFVYGWGVALNQNPAPQGYDFASWAEPSGGGHKVARVATADLLDGGEWTFWNGADWVTNPRDAVLVEDTDGNPILGFTGTPYKVDTDHWINVGRTHVLDTYVDVWRADAPEGPWTKISRVPVPRVNDEVQAGYRQISHHTTIIPHATAPADHSIAMLTSTVLGSGGFEFDGADIRCFSPQFVVIPHEATP